MTMSTKDHDSNGTNGENTEVREDASLPDPADGPGVPVVGLGASAGGLSALERFFDQLSDSTQAAFVLVQHLAPDRESEMAELLQNHTGMKVTQIQDGQPVAPNNVYVIPPGASLEIRQSVLSLSEPHEQRGKRLPIDHFLRSLAEDQGDNAVCIIFSGTGSDGSLGLKAIKESAGICMVQDPDDAEYEGMPQSAIATGEVDIIATATELARRLNEYIEHDRSIELPRVAGSLPDDDTDALQTILSTVRQNTGNDFSSYKRSTILRRIARRIQVNQVASLEEYANFLRNYPQEVDSLFKDFLISVTNFFRDTEAFEYVEEDVIPELVKRRDENGQIRVWVAGCATGEEAYSIAMQLLEQTDAKHRPPNLQVFATDLDDDALDFARRGTYPSSIAADVSPERLDRFFVEEKDGYRVTTQLKDVVLFAHHNLLTDPPFSDLDLVTCRNLLIYLERDVQQRLFDMFHYALNEDGVLFLGGSESPENVSNIFEGVNKAHRVYRCRKVPEKMPSFFPVNTITDVGDEAQDGGASGRSKTMSFGEIHRTLMLEEYAPPGVIVDEDYSIVHLFGNVGRILRPTEGDPTQNLLEKVGQNLRLELRPALFRAFERGESVSSRHVREQVDDQTRLINLSVRPLKHSAITGNYVHVVFDEVEDAPEALLRPDEADASGELVEHLEKELDRTKERLQTVTEEFETSNEELKASNEELQSMNEELRSTTEELETSKEELQSTNEELVTVNHELKTKIEELNEANADLENLLASTDIGTIFLNRDLNIKRFTPGMKSLFNLIDEDKGRPFSHISHALEYDGFVEDAEEVLDTLKPREIETESEDGRYLLVRILPYRTRDDRVDGVVLTFIDITARRTAEAEVKERARQQAVLARLGQMALRTEDTEQLKGQILEEVARAFDAQYCMILRLVDGALELDQGRGWDEGELQSIAANMGQSSHVGYTLTVDEPVIVNDFAADDRFAGPKRLADEDLQSGMSVAIHGEDDPYGILAVHAAEPAEYTVDDANFLHSVANLLGEFIRRTRTEEALREAKEEAEAATHAKSAFLANISHDLRTPLTALSGLAEVLQRRLDGDDATMVEQILDSADQLEKTLNAVLQFVDHGNTLTLTPKPVDVRSVVESVVGVVRESAPDAVDIRIDGPTDDEGSPQPVDAHLDETALNRVISNLVGNAVKFTDEGYVCVRIRERDEQLQIVVADTGEGMEADFLDRAFEPFEQQTMGAHRKHGGHGLGLAIVLELVEAMEGSVRVKSQPGRGTVFLVELPRSIGDASAGSSETSESQSPNASTSERGPAPSSMRPTEPKTEEGDSGKSGLQEEVAETDMPENGAPENGAPENEAPENRGEDGDEEGSDRMSLLLLEDNENSRYMFEHLLEDDFDVTSCLTYQGALDAAKNQRFDILLLDIHLDGQESGVDALHAIRDLPGYDAVPAVACTAFAREEERQSFLDDRFDRCVAKPVDTRKLRELLKEIVRDASRTSGT